MSKTVTLLRPFTFSYPSNGGEHHRLTREKKFTPERNKEGEWIPTEVNIPDEIAAHPFIAEQYADGCIERPDVTAARVKTLKEKQAKEDALAAQELKKAEDALKRASGAHKVHQANESEVAKQLDTPVNQLGAQQGKGIDEKALADALNTPANELAAGNIKPVKK